MDTTLLTAYTALMAVAAGAAWRAHFRMPANQRRDGVAAVAGVCAVVSVVALWRALE